MVDSYCGYYRSLLFYLCYAGPSTKQVYYADYSLGDVQY